MIRMHSRAIGRLAFLAIIGVGGAALSGSGQSSAPPRAALFTDAQASAGEALYRQSCAPCHGATLSGGIAPALTGPAFETSWSDPRVTLGDIFFWRAPRCRRARRARCRRPITPRCSPTS
jgi:hypothetical protein